MKLRPINIKMLPSPIQVGLYKKTANPRLGLQVSRKAKGGSSAAARITGDHWAVAAATTNGALKKTGKCFQPCAESAKARRNELNPKKTAPAAEGFKNVKGMLAIAAVSG